MAERTAYGCGVTALHADKGTAASFVAEIKECAAEIGAEFACVFFSQEHWPPQEIADAMRRLAPCVRYAACSTAGELAPAGLQENSIVAILFPSEAFSIEARMIDAMSVSGMDRIVSEVASMRHALEGRGGPTSGGRLFAVSLIDGLSYAEEAVTSAIHWGLDDIPLIGGSAGDNLRFERTTLILDGQVHSDCAVILLFRTTVPFHVFKTDNFVPTDEKLVVTASDPDRRMVFEFNAGVAAEEYADAIGIEWHSLTPLSFASHPLVVRVGGEYFCRSIQKMNPDGSLSFFCAIDDGIVLTIAQPKGMVESTREKLKDLRASLDGIDFVLGFDCVLRKLDAQNRQVLRKISELYRDNNVIGFGTYGEQYRSMHLNQTLTGIAFGRRQAAE